MTIVDFPIEPAHRSIVTPRRSPQPYVPRGRRLLASVLTLCAVLGACSPATPEAPQESSLSTQSAALTSVPQLSPEFLVNPGATVDAAHEDAVVAAGNGIYLVVWMEASNATSGPDIRGVRIRASDGARLDANPILIATDVVVQIQPAVAFDGTNFLVAWDEIHGVPTIVGARVRASDGAVLDSTPFLISRMPTAPFMLPQSSPALAFDGTNYLATWSGYFYSNGPVFDGVIGIRVRPDGTTVESTSFFIAQSGSASRVGCTNGTCLVTYQKSQNVEGLRISAATGQVLDSTPISFAATAGNERSPAVVGRSGEFLVTWIGADNNLWARRVKASDGVKLDTADIAVGPAADAPPEVGSDGVDYWINWQGLRGGARRVLVTRVSASGVVAADAELVLSNVPTSSTRNRGGIASVASGTFLATYTKLDNPTGKQRGHMMRAAQGFPHVSPEQAVSLATPEGAVHLPTAVAAGNGLYLVVWPESSAAANGRPDLLGVRVRASDGALLDAVPLRIGTTLEDVDFEPAVAFDGTNFLVTWTKIGFTPTIVGARVRASDGAVLDATPLVISHPPTGPYTGLPQFESAVAFDGTNYLVTWRGIAYVYGTYSEGILATRVRPSDGAILDLPSTVISANGVTPSVAYASGSYLVAWTQHSDVMAARISAATGQVMDPSAISFGATSGNEGESVVAARDGEFLVVWKDGNSALWARQLRASDGVKLGTADIAVGTGSQNRPVATFDGADYRIAWMSSRSGIPTLLGSRVSTQGVVATDGELTVSQLNDRAGLSRAGIAATSPGHLMVSYSQYDAVAGATRAKFRLVSDEQAPEPCDAAGAPTLVLNGAVPLTLECGSGGYQDPGAQAFDACGHAIAVHAYNTGTDSSGPGPNLSFEGSYTVSYAAWDAMGHTVNASRTVVVDDRTAPTLTLKGAARMTHTCGSQWVDPGVEATDACYGNLAPQVQRVGSVNGWAVGTYTVTYKLTDAGGNSATPVTRTVDVVNCPW